MVKDFPKLPNGFETSMIRRLPKPQGEAAVTLYSKNARQRLVDRLENSNNKTVVICSTGGSATAGAYLRKHLIDTHRWDFAFVHNLEYSFRGNSRPRIQLENRGHGGRKSFHTAYLMHSFVPKETDLIIWEFSLNDHMDCEAQRNALIMYLDQIEKVNNPPPLVILAYLWDTWAFHEETIPEWKNQSIPAEIVQCHQYLAASYDFVVGSVSLAGYLDHLAWDPWLLKRLFVMGSTHPMATGEWMLGYLLWDLVRDDAREEQGGTDKNKMIPSPTIHIPCSLDSLTRCQQRLVDIVYNHHPKASWSSELPINVKLRSGMIQAIHYHGNDGSVEGNLTIIENGKADPLRSDRKNSYALPCCTTGERLQFDLRSLHVVGEPSSSSLATGTTILALSITHPGVQPEDLAEYVNMDLWGASGTKLLNESAFIASTEWCLLPGECQIESWSTMVLPSATTVSKIDFCSQMPDCMLEQEETQKGASLMHLVLY